ALTDSQVRVLKRGAGKAILMFDSDAAGQKATDRAIQLMEAQDLLVQIAVVEGGKDPADLVQKGEADLLHRLLEKPADSFPYSLGKALAGQDRTRAEGRERIRDILFPFIAAAASPMRRDGYLTLLADNLGVDARAVRQDFSAWLRKRQPGSSRSAEGGSGHGDPGTAGSSGVSADLFLMLAVSAHREL